MKANVIIATLMMSAAVLGGCSSDDRSPVEKANSLLRQRNLWAVEKLDSVFEYQDTHSCLCAAYNLQWIADSVLISHQRSGTPFSTPEKKDALDNSKMARDLKVKAAELTLKHDLSHDKKEFVGFSVLMADSLTGTVMRVFFDKDITKISAIDRNYE